jgi:hypothetical protein
VSLVTLEVRCCCQPEKLLGWVEVPESQVFAGSELVVRRLDFTRPLPPDVGDPLAPVRIEEFRFQIERIVVAGNAEPHLALKAEGHSAEELQGPFGLLARWNFRRAWGS